MLWIKEHGGYVRNKVCLEGSFVTAGTNNPSVVNDGNSNMIASVTRVSAGLFEVTFASVDAGGPTDLPEKILDWSVNIAQATGATNIVDARLVRGSYSPVTRKFRILCVDYETPAATDPDSGDVICFALHGSTSSAGTD